MTERERLAKEVADKLEAAGINSDALCEAVSDVAQRAACATNNSGVEDQVLFLMDDIAGVDPDTIAAEIMERVRQ